jgi:multidrug transporter EmrE-like cation transporter
VKDYLYIGSTVLFTVYGQLIIKWQVTQAGPLPNNATEKGIFFLKLVTNPWVITGLLSAVVAAISWMATLTKFQLSYAYPFMSLAFVLVFGLSILLFHETLSIPKVIGLGAIVFGLIVLSRG